MRKLALAALSFSTAVFLCRYVFPFSWLFYIAAVSGLLTFTGFFFKPSARLRIFVVCLSLCAGFLWNALYVSLHVKPASSLDGTTGSVTAVALAAPEETEYGYKMPVSIRQDGAPDIRTRLYIYGEVPGIKAGNTICFTARFTLADTVFGEDTDAYFSKGIFLLAYAEGDVTITDTKTPINHWPAYIADLSGQMIRRIFPNDIQEFMCALLLGDQSGVYSDEVLSSALSSAGAAHIIAVSGMHLSFLVGFLNLTIKNKRRLAAAAIPLILLFMAVVGFRASLARAGIMQMFLLAAPLFKRENDCLTSLPASLMLILLINPFSAASAGLQLSFAATLGIALISEKLYSRLDEPLRLKKIYKYKPIRASVHFVFGSLSSTLGALIFSIPLTALHFGTVSVIAPVTNLLILLPVSVIFIGGIFALLLSFVFAPVGMALAFITAFPVRLITNVIIGLSRLPFAAVYTTSPAAVIWLVYVYAMLITFWLTRTHLRQLLLPAGLSIVSLCLLLVGSSVLTDSHGLTVTALDVGQGQSIVLTSGNYTAVVDCGSISGKDAGDLLIRYLKNSGRTQIDLLVLTHYHTDHAGGVEQVLSRFPVSAIAMPIPSTEEDELADDIQTMAAAKGIGTVYVTENLSASLDALTLTLFAPVGSTDENERGIVILCTQGDFDALITGDISAETEQQLLTLSNLPDIEVLVTGHHGSKYATSDELLDAVMPEVAVISVGYNSYGHPAPETIEKLMRAGIQIYRTDLLGNVSIKAW